MSAKIEKWKISDDDCTNSGLYDWSRVIAQQIWYLLLFYCSCIICWIRCQKHKVIYLRIEHIIAEKTGPYREKETALLKLMAHK